MAMQFLKSAAGSVATMVLTGLMLFLVAIGVVGYYQMLPEDRSAMWSSIWQGFGTTGQVILWGAVWLAAVVLFPLATFFVTAWAARRDSNLAGAALVGGYTAVDLLLLGWIFSWSIPGVGGWVLFGIAGLLAGVYNLLACDWLAERVQG